LLLRLVSFSWRPLPVPAPRLTDHSPLS
jgi:hypothetical protein